MKSTLKNNKENLVAALDLGSNSFKLMIAKIVSINGVLHIEELDTIKESLRLASGIDKDGYLSSQYSQKAFETLIRFGDRLRRFDQSSVTAVGTYTLRSIKNEDFLENAQKLLGFPIEIISGQEEAEFIYDGVMHVSPEIKGKQLIIDIGGGSTEIIIGDRKKIHESVSIPMGCVSFSSKYFNGTKTPEDTIRKSIKAAKNLLTKNLNTNYQDWNNAIGTSGTCRAIADIILLNNLDTMTNSPIDNIGGFITKKGMYAILEELILAGDVNKSHLGGIKNDRKLVIASGLSILIAIFDFLKIKQMEVTESALLYGSIHKRLFSLLDNPDNAVGAYKKIIPIESKNEIKNRCDEEIKLLEDKFYTDPKQTNRVYSTAINLYEKIIPKKDQKGNIKLLLWAVRLLEIGKSINLKNYHIYSSYIISNSELHGFTNKEKVRLSTLVHAHRASLSSYDFNKKYIDWKILFILRLSYILCKNRELIDTKCIDFKINDDEITLTFKKNWLEINPYLSYRLDKENSYWKKINPHYQIII
jgi:exopolyphosphatase/guanosine-5'-triphosphate,3'-diphosphate pyrophosphatase